MEKLKFKITVLGDGAVGKTALINNYIGGKFRGDYIKTIGAQFSKAEETVEFKRREKVGESMLSLIIWDIAGQVDFTFMRPTFYKNTDGAIIVYSLEENELGRISFRNISKWYKDIKTYCGEIPIILIGNKVDLVNERFVSFKEAFDLATENNWNYLECSAKTSKNVKEAFKMLCLLILGEKRVDLITTTKLDVTKEFSTYKKNFESKDFSELLALYSQISRPNFQISDTTQVSQGINLVQYLENNFNFITDKKTAQLTLSRLYDLFSKFYQKDENLNISQDYGFKSVKALLKEDINELKRKAAMKLVRWFWVKLDDFSNVDGWFEYLKKNEELYDLCMREGDQLFQLALSVYNALKSGNADILRDSEKKLEDIKDLFPEENDIIKDARKIIKEVYDNLPIVRIIKYEFDPTTLIYKSPAILKITVKNNTTEEQHFIVSVNSSGFEILKDKQKRIIKSNKELCVSFLLGQVNATSDKKLSTLIRLFDGDMNIFEEIFAKIPDVKVDPTISLEEPPIEEKKELLIFMSYATKDAEIFKIKDISRILTSKKEISDVLYWEEDTENNIQKYMSDNLKKCDVLLLFCSPNARKSDAVEDEWTAANTMRKPIIPIFTDLDHIPTLLKPRKGVKYDMFDFDKTIKELYDLILKKTKKDFSEQN